jgi:predicted TIM-barrel fold metal-dependent hydrolase
LPDVEGSLIELEYALDILKADGIKFTSNAEGLYLGDPRMDEIFQEMSKRGTIGLLHPTLPGKVPDTCQRVPIPLMEFMFDSMRAVANMMFNGVFKRCPGMKFVVPHAGGCLSMLVDRFEGMAERSGNIENPPHVFEEIKSLYFDMAAYNWPRVLPALGSYIDIDHMVYGSDYPYMSDYETSTLGRTLMDSGFFSDEGLKKMLYENAKKLIPRLK